MAIGAEVHKGGFEAGFNAGDASLVDVGFFLFTGAAFYVQVKQLLTIDHSDTQFFTVCGVY